MKKLLGLLATTGLIVGAGATAVSCGCGKEDKEFANFFKDLKDLNGENEKEIEGKIQEYIKGKQDKLKDGHKFKKAKLASQKPGSLDDKEVVFVWKLSDDGKKVTIIGYQGNKKGNEVEVKEIGKIEKNVSILVNEFKEFFKDFVINVKKEDEVEGVVKKYVEDKQEALKLGDKFKDAKLAKEKPVSLQDKEVVFVWKLTNKDTLTIEAYHGVKNNDKDEVKEIGKTEIKANIDPEGRLDISTEKKLDNFAVKAAISEDEAKKEINKKMQEINPALKEGEDYEINFKDDHALDEHKTTIDNQAIYINSLEKSKHIKNDRKILIGTKKSLDPDKKERVFYTELAYVVKADGGSIKERVVALNEKLDADEIEIVDIDVTAKTAKLKPIEGSVKYTGSAALKFLICEEGQKRDLSKAIVKKNVGEIDEATPEKIMEALKKTNSYLLYTEQLKVEIEEREGWAKVIAKGDSTYYGGQTSVKFCLKQK